jgi:chromate reductase, NAD(P)H dehydrogenase (quinone)
MSTIRAPRLIIISGSIRNGSINLKLARCCYSESQKLTLGGRMPPPHIVTADEVAALQKDIPLYNGDIEAAGFPEAALKLKNLLRDSDGLLVVNPEYNGSITPLMKNTLDWLSRPTEKGEVGYSAYKGKVCAIISTSPGGLGGMRAHNHMRDILLNLGCDVIGASATIGSGFSAFNEDGSLKDEKDTQKIYQVVNSLCHRAAMIANSEATRSLILESLPPCPSSIIAGTMGEL